MSLIQFQDLTLTATDQAIRGIIDDPLLGGYPELRDILYFHMGLDDPRSFYQGKRIRPLLVLLSTAACGGDWKFALPAAAAVEILHNFSLIHDDIEDQGTIRRGRETVWMKYGVPLAINAGDALFALVYSAALHLLPAISEDKVIQVITLLTEACVKLTGGQHLDISFEKDRKISVENYWKMISGKTASLISTSSRIGAVVAGADREQEDAMASFGFALGLAFQVYDDWLGIWGKSAETGKSSVSDLITGKKTLPILFGIEKQRQFAKLYHSGTIGHEDAAHLAELLTEEGAQAFTETEADRLTHQALKWLDKAKPQEPARQALIELTEMLMGRIR